MWNPLTSPHYPRIEIPDPETPSTDRIITAITDFIVRYPVPVVAAILAIAAVIGWRRGGVFKGIIIGFGLLLLILFFWRGLTG